MANISRPPNPITKLGHSSSGKPLNPLIVIYLITWFIRPEVIIYIGELEFTPMRIVGLILLVDLFVRSQVRLMWIDSIVAMSFSVTFVSVSISSDPLRAVVVTGRLMLDMIAPYFVGRLISTDLPRLDKTLRLIIVMLVLLLPTVAWESITRFNIHYTIWGVPDAIAKLVGGGHNQVRLGFMRATGWTGHPIMLGLTYATFIAVSIHYCFRQDGKSKAWAWIALMAISAGVFFSLSSGAWIMAAIPMAFFFYDRVLRLEGRVKWGFLGAGFAVIYLLLTALSSSNSPMFVMMYRLGLDDGAWLYRWQLWDRVFNVMPGHWWFGYGDKPPVFKHTYFSIDNNYLCTLLYGGYMSLLVWIALQTSVLASNIRYCWLGSDSTYKQLGRMMGFTMVGFIVAQLSVALFSTASMMFWLTLGMMTGISQTIALARTRAARVANTLGHARPIGA